MKTHPDVLDDQLKWLGGVLIDAVRRSESGPDDLVSITIRRSGADAPQAVAYLADADVLVEAGHILAALRHVRGGR